MGLQQSQTTYTITETENGYRRVYLSVMQLKADSFKVGDAIWQFPDGFKPIDGAAIPVNQSMAAIAWTGGDAHLFDGDKAWGTTTTLGEAYVGFSYVAKS